MAEKTPKIFTTFIKIRIVANKVDVFNKIKETHHRIGTANPQILLSALSRDLNMDIDELSRHLDGLLSMSLIKFKGTGKGAVELTRSGLTTNMKIITPREEPEVVPERV